MQSSRGGKTAYRLVRHGVGGKMGRNGDKNPSRRVARPTRGLRSFGSGREASASASVHGRSLGPAALDYRVVDGATSKWCMKVVQNGAWATPGKVEKWMVERRRIANVQKLEISGQKSGVGNADR